MISFLFWNVKRNPLQDRIARLARTFNVDVLLLAECDMDRQAMTASLSSESPMPFHFPAEQPGKVLLWTRLPHTSVIPQYDDPTKWSIWQMNVGLHPGFLLAATHLPSKLYTESYDREEAARSLAQAIARTEDTVGHCRTILVGDLNMNPFEYGVTGRVTLNAVMTRIIAQRLHRVTNGEQYRYFYNPMWGHFGDRTLGPAGTFYRSQSPFWNIYDQVLLRPGLADLLLDLRVLDHDGEESFLTAKGLPRRTDCSDYLPLLFQMNI